jgi:threonine aldolase
MNAVQTNIVLFSVENLSTTAERFIDGLNRKGLLVSSMEKFTIRLVTHGGVEKEDVRKALSILHEVAQGFNR